jgi:hypothetical protein
MIMNIMMMVNRIIIIAIFSISQVPREVPPGYSEFAK